MRSLTVEDLQSQTLLELPDRELMGALIYVTGKVQLTLLAHLLDRYFHSWSTLVSVDHNTVKVTVNDKAVTDSELRAFCTEASYNLSVRCTARLT